MNVQDSDAKKAKIRKQSAARQRRHRIKQLEAGYPRREFNLNDQENAAVVALITKLREKNGG